MGKRREFGFTLRGIVQRDGNGWIVQILPHSQHNSKQEAWLEKNEGREIKLAREDIRHPD